MSEKELKPFIHDADVRILLQWNNVVLFERTGSTWCYGVAKDGAVVMDDVGIDHASERYESELKKLNAPADIIAEAERLTIETSALADY